MVGPIIVLVVGIVAIILSFVKGFRILSLVALPLLTVFGEFAVMWFASNILKPAEGSGALLGGAVLGLSMLALIIYYPVLIIWYIYKRIKGNKSQDVSTPAQNDVMPPQV